MAQKKEFDSSRVVSLLPTKDDFVENKSEPVVNTLCFKGLDDYLGQEDLKRRVALYIKSSLIRKEPLDHVLIYGPPGLGKTTLACVIARELGASFKSTSAPSIEKVGDLVALLTALEPMDVFFIDEIHRLPIHIEEVLYSAMEGFFVDVILGQGIGAKSVKLPINKFTLIGATTKVSSVSAPLQTRFGIVEKIDFYNDKDLSEIILVDAKNASINVAPEAALEIAKCSRGTPRVAKRMFKRIFDYVFCHGHTLVTLPLAKEAMTFIGIDSLGLDELDRKVIAVLLQAGPEKPLGLETIASLVGEDRETIEDYCEPFLMRIGLIEKTPRGRKIVRDKYFILFGQTRLV